MESYRNEIRIGVLMAWGIHSVEPLKTSDQLDQAITQLAGRILTASEKIAFFIAYSIDGSWEDVHSQFTERLDKDVTLETVRRYADNSAEKIISHALESDELWFLSRNRHVEKLPDTKLQIHVPLVVVKVNLKGSELESFVYLQVNRLANEFFGLAPDSAQMFGASLEQALARAERWSNKRDFAAFVADQERIMPTYLENGYTRANVPIRFNKSHPNPAYRDKAFLPFILAVSVKRFDDGSEEHTALVAYVEQ